jgi:phosphatidylglycerol---prolipoprotein diacylglyceryl transferase
MMFFPSRAVALEILGFSVHWYGLLYLAGFLLAYALLPRLQSFRDLHLSREAWADVLSWSVLGVIIGGRLGYGIFYEPRHFAAHPLDLLKVWQGGMSFHGGMLGVLLALLLSARRHAIPLLTLGDVVVVPVALGLALGRIGNFLNLELYGAPTDLPWGIAIPGVEGLRHPTQLYAVAKDLFIAFVCFAHLTRIRLPHGETAALFLLLYGTLRFLLEFLREPTHTSFAFGVLTLTRGQLYTLPMFFGGVLILVWLRRRRGTS